MPEISPEIMEVLKQQDWDDIIPKLIVFAQGRIECYLMDGNTISGMSAEDFVDSAIEKVWTGIRSWDREKCPEIIELLFGVIKSDVGHRAKGSENCRTVVYDEGSIYEALDYDGRNFASSTPAQVLLKKEQEGKDNEFLMGFIDFLGQDQSLIRMTELIIDGCDKPSDIAEAMRIPVKDIYNLKKRLARCLIDYRKTKNTIKQAVVGRGVTR